MTMEEAYEAGSIPIREFMSRQIDVAGNHDDVHLFYQYMDPDAPLPSSFERCASKSVASGVHFERTEDSIPDGVSDLSSLSDRGILWWLASRSRWAC